MYESGENFMKKQKHLARIYIVLIILFALNLAAVLFDIKQFWGVNIAKFLPGWWQWMTIIKFIDN